MLWKHANESYTNRNTADNRVHHTRIMSRGDNKAPVLQKDIKVKMARKCACQKSETEVAQTHSLKIHSIDSTIEQKKAVLYPTELLNTLEPRRTTLNRLTFKIGSPVIILRNLDPLWFCNGTRGVVMPNSLEILIATGHRKGGQAMVPWIPIIP